MARVLIAGCGDVGAALGEALHAEGHRVWGLRRQVQLLPDAIEPIAGDLSVRDGIPPLPAGLDWVFYLAAANERSEAGYRSVYVDGPRNLAHALTRDKGAPRRLFFASSTGVYGQDDGSWVEEVSVTEPRHYTGQVMLEGEREALAAPWPVTVVRFAGIYGPGRTRLIDSVRGGATCTEFPPVFTNRIHRDDCARVLKHLMEHGAPEAVYLAVDNEPCTQCQVMDWIARRIGVPPPGRRRGERNGGGNKRCSNRGLRATGFSFKFPSYREGYASVLSGAP